MTSAAATPANSTCFPVSETTPGLFPDQEGNIQAQSRSYDTSVDAQRSPSEVKSDRSPRPSKWKPQDSGTSPITCSKAESSRTQVTKSFGTWLSPKKARRGGVVDRSIPLPDLADEGTDASSSGLEENVTLVPPAYRETRKISDASSLGSAIEGSTSLPSPLLPQFASSSIAPSHRERRRASSAEGALPNPSAAQADQDAPASAASPQRLSGLFGPVSIPGLDGSPLNQKTGRADRAQLELQRSIKKLDKALANLRRRRLALEAPTLGGILAEGSAQDGFNANTPSHLDNTDLPSSSHLSPTANTTPTRSRLFRTLGRASPSPSRRDSPHLPSPGTPDSPSNFRSWSSALHAILSPSPTLPRMFSSPSSREYSPALMVDQLETAQIVINNLVDQIRQAQREVLNALQCVGEYNEVSLNVAPAPRESVLLMAQAIVSGLDLPATGSASSSFKVLKQAAEALLSAFADVVERESPLPCEAPDSGISHAHILVQSFGTKLDTSATYDVFATGGESGSSEDTMKQRTQAFMSAYRGFASELRNYHNAARRERRKHRIDRRSARLQKASTLYSKQNDTAVSTDRSDRVAAHTNIALLSSQELFEHTLQRALRESLYTVEEIEAYDPRVILTLPRLAIAFGIRESSFPSWPLSEQRDAKANSSQVLLEVFLPRMCRALPISAVNSTKAMSPGNFDRLVQRLCVGDVHALAEVQHGEEAASMDSVFRAISTLADSSGVANKGRHTKLMRKVLRSYLAVSEGRPEDEDEDECTIARAFLAVAGLGS